MAKLIQAYWEQNTSQSGLSKRERQGCTYESYLPDPLMGRPIRLEGTVASDVSAAEHAILDLEHSATTLTNSDALSRILLRAESVNSSKIEGLEISPRRLLQADVARAQGEEPNDNTALEVLGNIDAMDYAIAEINARTRFSVDLLLQIHRRLVAGSFHEDKIAGKLRTTQNWIGGNSHNPCNASFIPPPPEHVERLLQDLCDYCNADDAPAVVQAALAHAQFETIHPFADGNGRVGRAIIHMILRRREMTKTITPPISLVLATLINDYIRGLNVVRYTGEPTSESAIDGLNEWVSTFTTACRRAVSDSYSFEAKIEELRTDWLTRIGQVRADSMVLKLIDVLPGTPIVTASSVREALKTSLPSALQAIARLVDAGILTEAKQNRKRRQIFEAREVLNQFTLLERQLASVPARPRP